MQTTKVRLGICFYNNQLFYSIKGGSSTPKLTHIGAINLNFNILQSLLERKEQHIQSLCSTVNSIEDRFEFNHLHFLLHPQQECWSVLPKLVYDDGDEREAHINILMHGVDRNNIHPSWHALSNEKFKLLNLRVDQTLKGIKTITKGRSNIHLQSAFEIGEHWIKHTQPGGSFLTIGCYDNCIAVSSFLLGNLRGTTYISFDHIENLPYFWLQQCKTHSWMQGLHEQTQVFGTNCSQVTELLKPLLDDSGSLTTMNTLDKMNVSADETTYGFDLEQAYPAVMMVL